MEPNHPPSSDDEPHGQVTPFVRGSRMALRRAAQIWIKRGYAIVYEDDHLVELAREDKTLRPWMIALGVASRKNADIPTVAARTLCDKRNRPDGLTKLPEECRPFYDLMQMAKLVPRD